MTSLGFPARLLDGMQRDRQVVEGELAKRFRTLGFAVRSPQATPSVAALARPADLADLYAFIYHATSATVHFRPGQLGRGVWGGNPDGWSST